MRLAQLLNMAFSVGGLLIVLIVLCGWLLLRPRSRAVRAALVIVVLWYTTVSVYAISHAAVRFWSRDFVPLTKAAAPGGRVALAVLGSGAYTVVDWSDNRTVIPDPIGLARTLEAARLYKLIDPAWVVSSGGLTDPRSGDIPPGEAMKRALVQLGVPSSRVVVKEQARDTHDEALSVAALVPKLNVDHVIVVTSGVHMRRALATFRAAGVPVTPAPAREETAGGLSWRAKYLPTQYGLFESSLVAHEIAGWVYYRLRGWR